MIEPTLKKIGLDDKQIAVYLSLLRLGPSPVRKVAMDAKVNRGTTYDTLKGLMRLGVVSYYHQDKHMYFVCEDPRKLTKVVAERQEELQRTKEELERVIPELQAFTDPAEGRGKPVVKYYEGSRGARSILEDVLATVEGLMPKEYYAYPSSTIKQHLYRAYPEFSEDRIARGIRVKAISIGEGGELRGLDQRKWLTHDAGAPTYFLIYGMKVAMISVDKEHDPRGVIIEDDAIARTYRFIFQKLWEVLP